MASIVTGFEYDIFISYRQKDNKGERWVTEFVHALKTELESTFKDDISIYFDENPHDGLHENYDVDDSLRDKLKCLIFIPIVSRTYCDPRSFAWQQEFKAFVTLASQDKFGLKVKLLNGNTTGRVLPIRIHELETEDVKLFESEIQAVLRPIDFVFKSTGVNRPLVPGDKKEDNPSRLVYRDQINKVANAVREIVSGLQQPQGTSNFNDEPKEETKVQNRLPKKRTLAFSAIALLLVSTISFFLLRNFYVMKNPRDSGLAILPFTNNTGSTEYDYYGVGMASEIRTKVSLSKQFNFLTSLQATLPYTNTQKTLPEIGNELGVDLILTGLYQKVGDKIKVQAELIDANNGKLIWTLPVETSASDFFEVQNKIADEVIRKFSIRQTPIQTSTTNNLEAYAKNAQGVDLIVRMLANDSSVERSVQFFKDAIALDSSYVDAWCSLVDAEGFLYMNKPTDLKIKTRIEEYLAVFDRLFPGTWQQGLVMGSYYYRVTHEFNKAINEFNKVLEVDPQNLYAIGVMSALYKRKLDFGKCLQFKQKAVLFEPGAAGIWKDIGDAFDLMGDYRNAMKVRLKASELSHDQENAIRTLRTAVMGGFQLDKLPPFVKERAGEEFEFWSNAVKGNLSELIKVTKKKKNYEWLVTAFLMKNQDDSAKYWAHEGLKRKEPPLEWFLQAAAGNRSKAFEISDSFFLPLIKTGDDKMMLASQYERRIAIHTTLGEYKEATNLLKQLNDQVPEFGDYGIFNYPWYNRIKKEYPSFQQALNNIKRQPMVDVEKIIKF